MNRKNLCDENCNECGILRSRNNRLLTKVFNELNDKFGDGVYEIVQNNCANLTACAECSIDDFCHIEGCTIIEELDKEEVKDV